YQRERRSQGDDRDGLPVDAVAREATPDSGAQRPTQNHVATGPLAEATEIGVRGLADARGRHAGGERGPAADGPDGKRGGAHWPRRTPPRGASERRADPGAAAWDQEMQPHGPERVAVAGKVLVTAGARSRRELAAPPPERRRECRGGDQPLRAVIAGFEAQQRGAGVQREQALLPARGGRERRGERRQIAVVMHVSRGEIDLAGDLACEQGRRRG